MDLDAAIAQIPFIDHHVHQPWKGRHLLSVNEFRRPFTEAALPGTWEQHLGNLIGYRWLIRELAKILNVAPDEATVVTARNARSETEYHRLLADNANLGAAYADDLFDFGNCIDVTAWAAILGRPVYRLLRVETFVEQGYADCATLDAALDRLRREVAAAPEHNVVGLKSIAGYRSGLAFAAPDSENQARAAAAYTRLRDAALGGGSGRIADRALVNMIVWTALEAAIPLRLPMQFHIGLGDDDIVMTKNDPTLMRALFTHEPFRDLPLILLHCYPYHRQAGYLASIYPNVYVDLGLTIPIVGPGAVRIIEETLELTPTSQLIASTDGHMTPEFQWFGVFVWRWALTRVLQGYVADNIMDEEAALSIASAVMRDNALRIHPLARG